jgi:hypothetical protein
MPPDQLDELVIYVLRDPKLRHLARSLMTPDCWCPHGERHLRILSDAIFKLDAEGQLSYPALRGAVTEALADDVLMKAVPHMVKDIIGLPTDPDPYNGLIFHAFKGVDEADLDFGYGVALLKRFLRERLVLDRVRRMIDGAGGRCPLGFEGTLAEAQATAAAIEALGHSGAPANMADGLPGLTAWLGATCVQGLIGLATGVPGLDEHTNGLRGLVIVGGSPGSGKSSLSIQAGVGTARRHLANNTAVLFISLDMDAIEIQARIMSNLSGLDWSVLRRGSPGCRDRPGGPHFNLEDAAKFEAAKTELAGETGRRIRVLGRKDLPGVLDAGRLAHLLAETKAAAGASKGLMIVDYIQLLEPPAVVAKQGDLSCDRWRVQLLRDVVARSSPEGADTVVAVSECRKPPDSKTSWGGMLADVMGSARTTYAADSVLLLRKPTPGEVRKSYGLAAGKAAVDARLVTLDEAGVSPVVLALVKARDGARRGEWMMEHLYKCSSWRQPPLVLPATGGMLGAADNDDDDDDDDDADLNDYLGAQLVARQRLLAALGAAPDGETATVLAQAAKLPIGPARAILVELVAEGRAVAVQVIKPHGKGGKGAKTHPGYRLAGVNGQPADGKTAITQTAVPAITQTNKPRDPGG